ncbi:protoheme IX farnesyltransferase [Plectosphaerella plurivora]|uniref:Protoheme IX farnesyltransferase, mitochondrial n=1 Tax=Plectosphaerella plurivora TaxID=936078 RepID=A0A9P8V3A8_9PEZI|nr:protoheme IX farnesyltransferase [Plectosphaerella plurivora]
MRPPPRSLLLVHAFDPATVCRRCTARLPSRASLAAPQITTARRLLSSTSPPRLSTSYFFPNNALDRAAPFSATAFPRNTATTTTTNTAATAQATSQEAASRVEDAGSGAELPHRRRQAKRKAEAAAAAAAAAGGGGSGKAGAGVLPAQDASSALTTAAAALPANSMRRNFSVFLSLTKPRLSALVVLTAMAPYALYPVNSFLTPAVTESPSLSPLTLLFLTTGTALCAASANSFNMLYEQSTDAKMSRTRNRPLVRKLITTRSAILFAVMCGISGTAALYYGVNPTVSFLGFANIVLYAGVYTPLKAVTVVNTWIGALVGGIPPLMGWAAAAGESATGDGSWRELLFSPDGSSIGGWLFASLLCAWQFPHFMALSWSIREEYKNAGLRMLAWTNPARNGRVALRYSIAFIPICLGLCAAGVTEWSFAITSMPVNGWLIWEAVRFWRHDGHKGTARGLFWASVWHLPAVMVLALLQKKGMWSRVWRSIVGDEPDEEWEDELEEMPVAAVPTRTAVKA